jgi:SET domain-containing protein
MGQQKTTTGVRSTKKWCAMIRVGPSSIDRQGLFATQEIKKGTRIVQYTGLKISKAEGARRAEAGNAYIFELNERYDIDGKSLSNIARYINHSCAPNCAVDMTTETIWIVATRRIRAGEELGYNYGYDIKNYTEYPCRCGAQNCCGYILDRQYWDLIQLQQ